MNINAVSTAAIIFNIGVAAFVAAAPTNSLPWWVIGGVAALNAIVHALPSSGVLPPAPPKP